uniref:DUF7794 domain-containing protein n=1 Tax=Physcomitrium patens TaxID=3218 RepID=A0A7I4F4M2_PHYPA
MEAFRRCNGVLFLNLLPLLVVGLIAVSASQADDAVIFVDSSIRPVHLRTTPPIEKEAFSFNDVATSLAVLLGVVPKAVDEKVASKIDSVVTPNPFHRPRAVLSVNIGGVDFDAISNEGTLGLLGLESYQLRPLIAEDAHFRQTIEVLTNLDTANIHTEVSEQDLEFVFMSASYDLNEDSKTVATISWDISSSESFSLDMSKSADRLFFKELMGLFRNMKRAVSSHQVVDLERPADLFSGTFNGIEELRKQYGSGHQTQLASKFVLHAMNQALQFLQENYNDKLVGVFTFTKSANNFEITTTERRSRFLQALAPTSGNETSPEDMSLRLGNQAVVFFTVIILLVALLLSTCCMFTMPLTRDSLLYSGLKSD